MSALPPRYPVSVTEHRRAPRRAGSDTLTALLAGAADGNMDAFEALYDHTCARLYGVALRVLRDSTSAQEALEAVYLQVWDTAVTFNPAEGSAQAWLTTLTHRIAVDQVRNEPYRAARMLGCGNGNLVGGCHYVMDAVRHHMVCAAGDALTDWQRELLALIYYGAMTYKEVAEFLGEPMSTVRSGIRFAVTRLGESAVTA